MIHVGDSLECLRVLESSSIDALVTDPPAGISFMGKSWDDDKGGRKQWIAWMSEVMSECLRVMKPGAHGFVWALPRTSHWTASALEDAGFEIRDVVTHIFGSGFPKSMDVSKAIDKAAGADRPVVGVVIKSTASMGKMDGNFSDDNFEWKSEFPITSPASDLAKQWVGWGTALKPASEHWILIRKPCSEKTVAKNVERWGTGAINVDGTRVASPDAKLDAIQRQSDVALFQGKGAGHCQSTYNQRGRFPANLILSHTDHCTEVQCEIECAIRAMDEQSGTLKSGTFNGKRAGLGFHGASGNHGKAYKGNQGDASRFFYCAKPAKSEKHAGLEGMPKRVASVGNLESAGRDGTNPKNYPKESCRRRIEAGLPPTEPRANHHPTVKPVRLMRYLIRMITPSGGLVLDPFLGSGTTGVAAKAELMRFIGIERDPEYAEIAGKRLASAPSTTSMEAPTEC